MIAHKIKIYMEQQQELHHLRQQNRDLNHEYTNAHQFKNTMEEAGLIKVDQQANIRALSQTGGNVNAAVDRLLSGL